MSRYILEIVKTGTRLGLLWKAKALMHSVNLDWPQIYHKPPHFLLLASSFLSS